MAFAYTVDGSSVIGAQRTTWGTFTNTGGGTGGTIATGLLAINTSNVVNGTAVGHAPFCSFSGGDLLITITADDDGFWSAIGYGGG